MHQSATCAYEDQTFWPVTMNSSPSLTARVRTLARSEPEPGSEKPWQKIVSPDRMPRRWIAFCSGVPCAMIVGPAMPRPITPTWSGASTLAISSR
jgi:hypothetical protein